MTAISLADRHTISSTYDRGAVIVNYQNGEQVYLGDAVYLSTDGKVYRTLGTVLASAKALGICVGTINQYAETSVPANSWVAVAVYGPVYGFVGLIDGGQIWVSRTVAGGMDDAAVSGGVYSFIMGRAIADDTIFVSPGQTTPASTA